MLKKLVRHLLFSIISIYLLSLVNSGFTYGGDVKTLFLAGFVMFFLQLVIEPILKIILFPINFLTRGLFSWVIGVGLFYALTYFVPAIHIKSWYFPGLILPLLKNFTLRIPSYNFSFWPNLILLSYLHTLFTGIMNWLCEE